MNGMKNLVVMSAAPWKAQFPVGQRDKGGHFNESIKRKIPVKGPVAGGKACGPGAGEVTEGGGPEPDFAGNALDVAG
jgi:hypothetical protein